MHPRSLPDPLGSVPFLVHEHVSTVGRERLRRRDLEAPAFGIRAPPGTGLTPWSLAPALRADDRFSHLTAARLWRLPLPWNAPPLPLPLHVTTEGDGAVMRRPGVVGHRSCVVGRRHTRGLPVSTPTQVFVECGTLLGLDDLVALGDAVAGASGSSGLRRLTAAVARHGGGRGAPRLREALALVRQNVESPKETQLRLLIIRAGLPEPSLNAPAFDSRGRTLGRPDLSYPAVKVGIEYEGDQHRTDRDRWRRDIRRRERFAAAGWRTLRVTDDDLGPHAAEFLSRLRSAVGRR